MKTDYPSIYVSTYDKYNSGSLKGEWVAVELFADREEFLAHCKELHSDEDSPELMFQDSDGVPSCWVTEAGWVSPLIWDWLTLSTCQREIVDAYLTGIDTNLSDLEIPIDCHVGSYAINCETLERAKHNWLNEWLEDTGFFDGWSETAKRYFDDAAYLRDCEIDSFYFVKMGSTLHVFYQN
jgi:antirestriction protein